MYFQNETNIDAPHDWLIYYDAELGTHILSFTLRGGNVQQKIRLSLSQKDIKDLRDGLNRHSYKLVNAPEKAIPTSEDVVFINNTSFEGE